MQKKANLFGHMKKMSYLCTVVKCKLCFITYNNQFNSLILKFI